MKPSELIYRVWDVKHGYYINRNAGEENGHINNLSQGIHGLYDKSADIELYTGFKDSEGNMIFDGDIVEVTKYFYNPSPDKYTVTMENGQWSFAKDLGYICPISKIMNDKDIIGIKVVGTVHEQELEKSQIIEER